MWAYREVGYGSSRAEESINTLVIRPSVAMVTLIVVPRIREGFINLNAV